MLHPHFLARYQYPRWRLEGVWAICCRYWPQKIHDHVSERCVVVAQSPARYSWKQALVVPRAGQILMIIEVSAHVVTRGCFTYAAASLAKWCLVAEQCHLRYLCHTRVQQRRPTHYNGQLVVLECGRVQSAYDSRDSDCLNRSCRKPKGVICSTGQPLR